MELEALTGSERVGIGAVLGQKGRNFPYECLPDDESQKTTKRMRGKNIYLDWPAT